MTKLIQPLRTEVVGLQLQRSRITTVSSYEKLMSKCDELISRVEKELGKYNDGEIKQKLGLILNDAKAVRSETESKRRATVDKLNVQMTDIEQSVDGIKPGDAQTQEFVAKEFTFSNNLRIELKTSSESIGWRKRPN